MIIYLYGLPCTGKTFIGNLISSHSEFKKYFFYFKDADDYLPINLKNKIREGIHFNDNEIVEYHKIISSKIEEIKKDKKNIVISQASLLKKNRNIIKKMHKDIIFVNIKTKIDIIYKRLKLRGGFISKEYIKHLIQFLQIDKNDIILENNSPNLKNLIIEIKKKLKL